MATYSQVSATPCCDKWKYRLAHLGAGSVSIVDTTDLVRATTRISQGSQAAPVQKGEKNIGCVVA